MKRFLIIPIILLWSSAPDFAQETIRADEQIIYKQVDTISLAMDIYYPPGMDKTKTYPAMIFFFGGGWNGGTLQHFAPQARYFSERGLVCFAADYRVFNRHGTPPFEALKDAKSAMRYLRAHAEEFHIDANRIVASGGSAGGHLAAATALCPGYDDPADDFSVPVKPNALVLFNPVIDNGPGGYGYERVGEEYKDFSPLHNIRKGAPPTIIFLGTEDSLVPVETARYYQKVMERVGSRCDLFLYEGQSHGFFNANKSMEHHLQTILEADRFMISLGYLQGEPTIK
jgi:acetyl esterase